MPNGGRVPTPTLERLTTYYATLTDLKRSSAETISSYGMEELTGINAAQFRKDLSYFGEFGRPGIGYNVHDLQARISKILKLDKPIPILLVGAGNLGSALAGYPALRSGNFHIVAVFDNNPNKIGKQLWDLAIMDMSVMAEENKVLNAKIGIVAVPAHAGQEVAEKLVDAGIYNILNFAPVVLKLPREVMVRNVDFVQELAVLSYHLPNNAAR